RLGLILLISLGVLADEVDEKQVLLLVTYRVLGQDLALFLEQSLAILAGIIKRQTFGDDVERRRVILLAGIHPAQIVARPHVRRIDLQRLQVGRAGLGSAAKLVQSVAQRVPQLRGAGWIEP